MNYNKKKLKFKSEQENIQLTIKKLLLFFISTQLYIIHSIDSSLSFAFKNRYSNNATQY